MTSIEIEARVRTDFAAVAGRVVLLSSVSAYRDDSSVDVALDPPARFRVAARVPETDLSRWTVDDWCDPVWDVEPAEARPELVGLSAFWTHGPSYQETTGKTEGVMPRLG